MDKLILLACFDHLEASFSEKKVLFIKFYLPAETTGLPAENVNETSAV